MAHAAIIFLHLLGSVLMFAALGIEAAMLGQLSRATRVHDVRSALESSKISRVVGPLSLLLAVVPGFYLAAQIGDATKLWVGPSLAGLVVVIALGAAVTGRNVVKLERSLPKEDAAPAILTERNDLR